MVIGPITFKAAKSFINEHHRHCNATIGCKFCLGLYEDDALVGCAVCGRPVSRKLDDGKTLEINRVCTNGIKNGCSMLYGAACRIAKNMGYEKVITYTLMSEPGTSVKASGFILEAENCGGTHWTGTRDKGQKLPRELKRRWTKSLLHK